MTSKLIITVSILQITLTLTAPLQIPYLQTVQEMMQQQMSLQGSIQPQVPSLQPLQGTIQQQRLALQEQMFALQQFQALQRMNVIPSPMAMNSPPILVLFPNKESDVRRTDFNIQSLKYQKAEEIGDDDSDVIDAEPTDETNVKGSPIRAVLLMPNTRSFIGDFISSMPFLPIEINVPDSISWIYNAIAGIISGIGQSLPFRPQTPNSETQNEVNMKSIWNRIKNKQEMPTVVIPLGQPTLPMQL
ncbi:Uncharacterized protein OBRU01_22791 [Operophtera brumata]|uniref:Uncharacterized protein n=1 Tax=Operophtera brumata TaxID=104452 RepID=A0A0L7KQ50_OPEBR|nr:Uncharacterized protein OBRU01_22791 [Operophtera brumata]